MRAVLATAAALTLCVAASGCGDEAALRVQQERQVRSLCGSLLARAGAPPAFVAGALEAPPSDFSFAPGSGRTSVADTVRQRCR